MTWHVVTPELPYLDDPDYRSAIVFNVRSALGPDVDLDLSLAEEGYGKIEVKVDPGDELVLSRVPLVRRVRHYVDQMGRRLRSPEAL